MYQYIQINNTLLSSKSTSERKAVVAHEVGHTLGLLHNDSGSSCSSYKLLNSQGDLLFACGIYTTQADDRNGVNSIY